MAILNYLDRFIVLITSVIVATLMAVMTLTVIIGVFYRYVLNDALPWPEELARFSMIWIAWLGGGIAIRRGAHVATDLLVTQLSPGPRRLLLLVGNVLAVGFLVILLVYGLELVQRVKFQSTIALGVSMQVPYSAAPLGAALMIYHFLVLMFAPSAGPARDGQLEV